MIWLLVPILLFLCVLALIYYLKSREDHEFSWTGKISDLDVICHLLMSTRRQERSVDISSSKSDLVVRLNLTEPSPSMQFLEKRRIDDKSEVAKGVEMASAHPVVAEMSDTGEIPATSKDLAKALKRIFRESFGTARQAKPYFTVRGHRWDLVVIKSFAVGHLARDKALMLPAPTSIVTEEKVREGRTGVIFFCAGMLIGPIPFVVCYYLYGLWAAAVASIVMFVLFRTARYLRKGNLGDNWFWVLLPFLLPAMAAATVLTDDTWYLLKSLNFFCLVLIAATVSCWVRNKTTSEVMKLPERRQSTPAVLAVGIDVCLIVLLTAAVYLNEALAARDSLEVWVWYFAFFGLELCVGLLGAVIPLFLVATYREQLND